MRGTDRWVLGTLQGLVLLLPLFLGGRQTIGVAMGCFAVLCLLAITIRERWRRHGGTSVPGLTALAAFAALALLMAAPLPPALIERLSPATARLYREVLDGWPGGGGWSVWRPLAFSAYDVAATLSRFSIGLGAFAVLVAFPWRTSEGEDEPRLVVLDRLIMTLILGGVGMALLAIAQEVFGNGWVMWITEEPADEKRVSGPFVNPNHLAAWLEMVMPLTMAYALTLLTRLRRRIEGTARSSRGLGVRSRRIWIAALVAHQERLWPPIVVAVGFLVMLGVHGATDSRGGNIALLFGLAVTGAGLTRHLIEPSERFGLRKWLPTVLPVLFALFALTIAAAWWRADTRVAEMGLEGSVDLSLAARVAAYRLGVGILRDFPIFGTGLGSWLDAFRPYQAPPLETGILDHAHNDYLELAAETGAVGMAIAFWFVCSVAVAVWRLRRGAVHDLGLVLRGEGGRGASRAARRPDGFEIPEWRRAIRHHHLIRWGLAGGVVAILVHCLVEFALRMPANLLLLMVLVAMMVLSAGSLRPGRVAAVGVLFSCLLAAAIPPAVNAFLVYLDRDPISPRDQIERADYLVSEDPEEGYDRAVSLARKAVDAAPACIEAHEMMAEALGPGSEGVGSLKRAVLLQPWAVERRDALGVRLLEEGDIEGGARELGESMFRYPYLVMHGYLSLAVQPDRSTDIDLSQALRRLDQPVTMQSRIASIDPQVAESLEQGLRRAMDEPSVGIRSRPKITEELAQFLETRGEAGRAGDLLLEQGRAIQDVPFLRRAAADHLSVKDYASAERALLAAMLLAPDQATIYTSLATQVYAPLGEYDRADSVLDAGRRNAADLLPLHRSMSELLNLRKSAEWARLDRPHVSPVVQKEKVRSGTDGNGRKGNDAEMEP